MSEAIKTLAMLLAPSLKHDLEQFKSDLAFILVNPTDSYVDTRIKMEIGKFFELLKNETVREMEKLKAVEDDLPSLRV